VIRSSQAMACCERSAAIAATRSVAGICSIAAQRVAKAVAISLWASALADLPVLPRRLSIARAAKWAARAA